MIIGSNQKFRIILTYNNSCTCAFNLVLLSSSEETSHFFNRHCGNGYYRRHSILCYFCHSTCLTAVRCGSIRIGICCLRPSDPICCIYSFFQIISCRIYSNHGPPGYQSEYESHSYNGRPFLSCSNRFLFSGFFFCFLIKRLIFKPRFILKSVFSIFIELFTHNSVPLFLLNPFWFLFPFSVFKIGLNCDGIMKKSQRKCDSFLSL